MTSVSGMNQTPKSTTSISLRPLRSLLMALQIFGVS
jgi:hypothetical protein